MTLIYNALVTPFIQFVIPVASSYKISVNKERKHLVCIIYHCCKGTHIRRENSKAKNTILQNYTPTIIFCWRFGRYSFAYWKLLVLIYSILMAMHVVTLIRYLLLLLYYYRNTFNYNWLGSPAQYLYGDKKSR